MLILFSLIVMRMSGAIAFKPHVRKDQPALRCKRRALCSFCPCYSIPPEVPACTVSLPPCWSTASCCCWSCFVGPFNPLGFCQMELSVMVVRFASSAMDYVMGLNMAQIYDPQYNDPDDNHVGNVTMPF